MQKTTHSKQRRADRKARKKAAHKADRELAQQSTPEGTTARVSYSDLLSFAYAFGATESWEQFCQRHGCNSEPTSKPIPKPSVDWQQSGF